MTDSKGPVPDGGDDDVREVTLEDFMAQMAHQSLRIEARFRAIEQRIEAVRDYVEEVERELDRRAA